MFCVISKETGTIQAVLLTDGLHGFAIFNYDPCGMKWDPNMLQDNVVLGLSCDKPGNAFDLGTSSNNAFRPGGAIGHSQQRGRWLFQVDSLPADFTNPRLSCHEWYRRQNYDPYFDFIYQRFADNCPCSLVNAFWDWRFAEVRLDANTRHYQTKDNSKKTLRLAHVQNNRHSRNFISCFRG